MFYLKCNKDVGLINVCIIFLGYSSLFFILESGTDNPYILVKPIKQNDFTLQSLST